MMKKLLTIVLGLLCMTGLKAQTESTIANSDILYWVGTGSDSAIFVIDYGTGAVAWGYCFNTSASETIETMANAISDADPRMYYGWGMLTYVAHPVDFESGMYSFKVNGVMADELDDFEDYTLANGMLVKVSESEDAVWSTAISPATIMTTPVDATIAAEDINYWVGTGTDSLVFAVNWGNPDTALAWGLKFNAIDSLTILDVLQTICAADSRLGSDYPFTTITYTDGELLLNFDTAASFLNVPQFILNGDGNVNANTVVATGDFLKIGESAYGVGFDSIMGYAMGVVWTTEIHPVSVPDTTVTPQPEVPADATIAASDIVYWVGEGSNKVVFAVNWADTALAWGYRFSTDSVLVETIMDDIAAADPRFSYVGSNGWLSDINFVVTTGDTLGAQAYWMYNVNGLAAWYGYDQQKVVNNDIVKFGDVVDGIGYDYDTTYHYYMSYAWTRTIYPVSMPDTAVTPQPQNPVDATIAASDIVYWVGEGSNKVIFAVNWADTALAWGYKFSTDSVLVETIMDDIAAADPRFNYVGSNGWLTDINFVVAAGDTLGAVTPGWWMSTLNGNSSASQGMITMLANNDIFKWGDYAVGTIIDTATYAMVFTATVYPVSAPTTDGIDEVASIDMTVYPNPASEVLNVRCEAMQNCAEVAMFDMTGRKVFGQRVAEGTESVRIATSAMPNGVYMLRIGNSTAKVVVRH